MLTHLQAGCGLAHFHREEPISLTDTATGVVDHLRAPQRTTLAVEQAADDGQRAQYPQLPVANAATVEVVVHTGRLNHRGGGLRAFKVELHMSGLVGGHRDQVAPRPQIGSTAMAVVSA
ncbi:hypothetical protein D3C81_1588130 [compost metagenome]